MTVHILFSQDTLTVTATIKNVTVYHSAASIERTTKAIIPKGRSFIKIKDISIKVVPETIQVFCDQVLILGVNHNKDYPSQKNSTQAIASKNENILSLKDSIAFYKKKIEVLQQEESMILENKQVSGQNGLDVNILQANADFFRQRLSNISLSKLNCENSISSFQQEMQSLSSDILNLRMKMKEPSHYILVEIENELEIETEVNVKYVTTHASWVPFYNIRIEDTNQPLVLEYYAKVYQQTGADWKNIDLTISTGNPSTIINTQIWKPTS